MGAHYIEPYAGGASAALRLLYGGYVSSIQINDLNEGVYHFWKFAIEDPEKFCGRIKGAILTIEEWRRQRAVYLDRSATSADRGFATFYLNRTNRSGIITRGGPIGGLNQAGCWGLDARFNREALVERVKKVASFGSKIEVTQKDAYTILTDLAVTRLENPSPKSLVYLDPPYYAKGSRLYDNFYSDSDHRRIVSALNDMTGPWVVSYDANPQILEMYTPRVPLSYKLGYSASTSNEGAEVMYFSSDLRIPTVTSPAGISTATVKALEAGTRENLASHPTRSLDDADNGR